jgi:uncharacterized protein
MNLAHPVEPSERIATIDILRGIALFIVLAINTATEFRVSIFEQFLNGKTTAGIVAEISEALVVALHTKGFILFSFLFGVGLAIQFGRLDGNQRRFMLMVRRLAVLLAFGVTHIFLIWNGDILTEYAMVGFAVLPFLYGPRWLLAVMAALSLGVSVAMPLLPPVVSFPDSWWIIKHLGEAQRAYGSGGFLDILAFRVDEVRAIAPLHVYALPRTFGLFLLGALAWRTDVFRPASFERRSLAAATCLTIALGAGMTIMATRGNVFGWHLNWQGRAMLQSLAQLTLAAGYGAGIVMLANRPVGRKLLGWAGPVGRMAFTNYIAQSVILSGIFYGFGLALFGRLSVAQSLVIAIVIYAGQVAFSAWWLGRFRFGPIEWLWRSLMYGERQPLSRSPMPATDLPDPAAVT